MLLDIAASENWTWQVNLVADPDRVLAVSTGIIATADSAILDRDVRWFNLAREVVEEHVPDARLVSFAGPGI